MVDRLARLGESVGQDAPAFAHDERHEARQALLDEIGRAVEDAGALLGRRRVPQRRRFRGGGERCVSRRLVSFDDSADDVRAVGRIVRGARGTRLRLAVDDRHGAPVLGFRGRECRAERCERLGIREIEAARILALGLVQRNGKRNARMRLNFERGEALQRIGDDVLDRRALVDEAIDERRVGAVLQEPTHQIGQKILVPADRRIDAARQIGRDDLVVERLAHAVQALELEIAFLARERAHRCHGMRVVRRELREEGFRLGEEALDAGEIGNIGRELSRVDRIAGKAALLAALHFAVPVGALDEPHHEPALLPPREIGEPVEQRQRALLIGLHRKPQALPAGKLRGRRERRHEIEREVEPFRLLGIDGEPDPG